MLRIDPIGTRLLFPAACWLAAARSLADSPPDPAALPPVAEAFRAGFEAIREAELRAWVAFLAAPELEGREAGRRGYDIASRFCGSVLEQCGVRPAPVGKDGAPSYFQEFNLIRVEPDSEVSYLEVAGAPAAGAGAQPSDEPARFRLGEDVALRAGGDIDWSDPWVFAGLGEGAASDAPDDFHRIDLQKQIPLILPRRGRNAQEIRAAAAAGARRLAVISDDRVRSGIGIRPREFPEFAEPGRGPAESEPEVVYVSTRAADRILKPSGWSVETLRALEEKGKRLPRLELGGAAIRAVVKFRRIVLPTRNVVGMIEGADPELRKEVIVIGAHLDHVGVNGEKIYYGADDDASGSAAVLAVARAFAENPHRPRRSICLALFAAEEKGLHGSRYFVDHPPAPVEQLVAELQLDMIGRNEERRNRENAEENTNTIHLVGSKRRSRGLHRLIIETNRHLGLEFEYDEEGVFTRSDQFNFARKDIPVAFFFTGFHADYHQPSDTADKLNYPKMTRITRLVYLIAHVLADAPQRPQPDRRQSF